MLLPTESTTDFCTGRTDVDVDDTAIRPVGADPPESVGNVLGEETTAEALGNAVIDGDGLLEGRVFLDEEDGTEVFFLQERGTFRSLDDGWLHKVSTP